MPIVEERILTMARAMAMGNHRRILRRNTQLAEAAELGFWRKGMQIERVGSKTSEEWISDLFQNSTESVWRRMSSYMRSSLWALLMMLVGMRVERIVQRKCSTVNRSRSPRRQF